MDFIEGVVNFIHQGQPEGCVGKYWKLDSGKPTSPKISLSVIAQAISTGDNLDFNRIKEIVVKAGESAITGGSGFPGAVSCSYQ